MTHTVRPAGPEDLAATPAVEAAANEVFAELGDLDVGARAVLDDLTAGLVGALGEELLGLYAHGSVVAGDFAPARSDIDVLALVGRPPDEQMLAAVAPELAATEGRHPAWKGRLEVETVGLPTVEAFVGGDPAVGAGDSIMRVSRDASRAAQPRARLAGLGRGHAARRRAGPLGADALPRMVRRGGGRAAVEADGGRPVREGVVSRGSRARADVS